MQIVHHKKDDDISYRLFYFMWIKFDKTNQFKTIEIRNFLMYNLYVIGFIQNNLRKETRL